MVKTVDLIMKKSKMERQKNSLRIIPVAFILIGFILSFSKQGRSLYEKGIADSTYQSSIRVVSGD